MPQVRRERAQRASHAPGASRRSGERGRVSGSSAFAKGYGGRRRSFSGGVPRGEAPRIRLDRALSKLGLASRTEARRLIADGTVTVGGRVVRDAARLVDFQTAKIVVEGRRPQAAAWRTIALHKPRGVVTTRRDPEGRKTVFDLLGEEGRGLVAVGRLDLASTGLLLLTTDTHLAAWLTDPANAIIRRYIVTARGSVSDDAVARLERGIGDLKAHSVQVLKRSKRETHLKIELTEGRNREIRRLLEAVGHHVTRLLRVSFGGIELGTLQPGKFREVESADFERMLAPCN
jgi:23S rRNA pseudouridine2605 synthase